MTDKQPCDDCEERLLEQLARNAAAGVMSGGLVDGVLATGVHDHGEGPTVLVSVMVGGAEYWLNIYRAPDDGGGDRERTPVPKVFRELS